MKHKRVLFMLVSLALAILVAGCGTSNDSNTATTEKASQETKTSATEGTKITMPEERPSYMAKVKEIIGNEVTIYKAEIPAAPPKDQGQSTQGKQAQPQANAQTQATDKTQANAGQSQGNRGFRMNFSDKEEKIMIPVGTPIVSMQRGSAEVSEVALTDIKADTILRIWEKDGTITFVQVANSGGQRNNQQNGSGNRQNNEGGGGGMGGPPPGM